MVVVEKMEKRSLVREMIKVFIYVLPLRICMWYCRCCMKHIVPSLQPVIVGRRRRDDSLLHKHGSSSSSTALPNFWLDGAEDSKFDLPFATHDASGVTLPCGKVQ